jgi:hypothetical protein
MPVKTETAPFSAWKTSEWGEALKLVAQAGYTGTVACARNKKTSAAGLQTSLDFLSPKGITKASNQQTTRAINEIRARLVWKDCLPNGKPLLYTKYERARSRKRTENNTIPFLSIQNLHLISLASYRKQKVI